MYRRVLATGVTAAAILGAGATAMAVTGSTPTAGAPSTSSSFAPHHPKAGKHGKGDRKGLGTLGKRVVHAQIVTKGKTGYVTHDLIRGTVTTVSSTSITVVATDKKSETFALTKDTKVRARAAGVKGKGAVSTISKVAVGDSVFVAGTGTSTLTAKHVVDLGKK